jgi:hypothetical protein
MDETPSLSYACPHPPPPNDVVNAHPRPYYYLENFTVALDWLRARYHDLLSEEEQRFISDFTRLPLASAALTVRMEMRQGDLFRTSKLDYAEIGCPRAAAAPLIELGWVDPDPPLDFPSLWRLLRKSEICTALGLGRASSIRKTELIALAGDLTAHTRTLREWWPAAPDGVFQVRVTPLCERLRLMFFGNFHQAWSEFVLADLGIFRYESVSLEESARAFRTRRQVDQFHAIYRCRELLQQERPLEEVLAALPPPLGRDSSDLWIDAKRAKLLFVIGQLYEKAHEWHRALAVYGECDHPEARIRAIRVLEKLERLQEAAELLGRVRQQPASELEAQLAARILRRLSRKCGEQEPIQNREPHHWDTLELQLPYPDPPQAVEIAVSEYLSAPHAPVLYVENTLLNALFGLLCWDAIFAPLPGAFFHAFHSAPADLLEGDFFARRATQFSACFARLEDGTYRDTILDTFELKMGLQTPFVAWTWLTREALELALDCIPAAHLQRIFRRLLADLRTNRSGLPDLIQLWPQQRRYRLIEVKGPGDRLQDNQTRWLSYCVAQEIPVCVCKVAWRAAQ